MKVKVIEKNRNKMGEWLHADLLKGKIYDAEPFAGKSEDCKGYCRIVDESGEDYLYPPMLFKIIEE